MLAQLLVERRQRLIEQQHARALYQRTRQRNPRVGRNPKPGDRVEVPAKKIPFFKPSKELKDLVNHGEGAQAVAAPPTAPPAPAQ